ncbi:hypothetical protein [Thermogemmatispora sp.]|uniref:hypothetical protein n=1 Tax=Thermogemmatispora sp. TaxID=1968838 RepID=UPI0035E437F1
MARNLYRSYLYVILLILLGLTVYALAFLFMPLWRLTPLRAAAETVPERAEVVQSLVFAGAVLLVVAILGGVHYWLLRRDLRQEPVAGSGAVRAFFLNLGELVLAPMSIFSLGQALLSPQSGYVATGLAAFAGWLALEWERRRLPAGPGLAQLFQRLHVYGVQAILLFPLFGTAIYALFLLQAAWLGSESAQVASACLSLSPCGEQPGLGAYLTEALWFLIAWCAYAYLNRHDAGSLLRRLLYAASLAYALFLVVEEVAALVDLLLRFLAGLSIGTDDLLSPPGSLIGGERLAALPVGLLVAAISWLWLRSEVDLWPEPQRARAVLGSAVMAIGAALLALLLWVGAGRLLLAFLFVAFPTGPRPLLGDWLDGLAPFLVGLATLPLDLLLRRRVRREPEQALLARRGFVLAVIAAGILAATIGGAFALYAWGTAALGVPLDNWPRLGQQGLAVTLIGLVVTGLYLWRAFREGLLRFAPATVPAPRQPEPAAVEVATAAQAAPPSQPGSPLENSEAAESLEAILESLIAQRLTLAEAAARIRALARRSPSL